MRLISVISLTAALGIVPALADAQTAAGTASGSTTIPGTTVPGSATGGTGGSAAAGGTSATTLGIGATSTTPSGGSSSLSTGGAAAGPHAQEKSKVHETGQGTLKGQSKAQSHDGGTFSKSRTKTTVGEGGVESTTRSMSHVPGEKPVKSTTTIGTTTGQ
jgi:hypothetical protein